MLAAAVCMMAQSRQHRRRRAPNVDRRRESRGKNLMEDYFIPNSLYPASKFRERYRMQLHLFQKIMHDICNYDTYFIQKHDAVGALGLLPEQKLTATLRMLAYGASAEQGVHSQTHTKRPATASTKRRGSRFPRNDWKHRLHALAVEELSYCLARRLRESEGPKKMTSMSLVNPRCSMRYCKVIPPRRTTFVKTIQNPQSEKERSFACFQECYRKDVEWCFGILQARWAIIRGAARMLDEEVLRSIMMTCIMLRCIMMTCIILHNMIVEDKYDYDAPEVFESDPMNTTLTRIYERPIGPNGLPMEPEPLLRDGQFNNPMIDRYQEMQSSYVHEIRQGDLVEHLWEMKGNHNG
ncbi:unnamed protein product [Prunus armeniaca]